MPAGATVAVVGASGAGKSTVASLLLRFWDPQSGAVRLDGADLRGLKLDSLRERVALVTQDTYLFNDTLEGNILLARPEASREELQRALEQAALADFVNCPTACAPASANAACSCRAASASASRSRGRS